MNSVDELARALCVHERTLRRAWTAGTIRGSRPTPHRLQIPVEERTYLRRHWPTLSRLRQALRTEPSVSMAVVFGSVARGDDVAGSDVDVLIALSKPRLSSRVELTDRLRGRTGLPIEVVELQDAARHPLLMKEILSDGRVLVDRDGRWPQLQARRCEISERAAGERRLRAERARDAVAAFERRAQG